MDQHWIPRSYLAAWADPRVPKNKGKRVHVYGRDGAYRQWSDPAQLFRRPHLYTKLGPAGEPDLRTEQMLSRIESDFARTRRALEKMKPIQPKHLASLAAFVAALRNRSPSAHDHISNFWKRVLSVAENVEAQLAQASPAEKEEIARALSSPLSSKREPSMSIADVREAAGLPIGSTVPEFLRIEAPLLAQLKLTVVKTHEELGFIASDNPVVWWDPTRASSPRMWPIGLGHIDVEVTVPIRCRGDGPHISAVVPRLYARLEPTRLCAYQRDRAK